MAALSLVGVGGVKRELFNSRVSKVCVALGLWGAGVALIVSLVSGTPVHPGVLVLAGLLAAVSGWAAVRWSLAPLATFPAPARPISRVVEVGSVITPTGQRRTFARPEERRRFASTYHVPTVGGKLASKYVENGFSTEQQIGRARRTGYAWYARYAWPADQARHTDHSDHPEHAEHGEHIGRVKRIGRAELSGRAERIGKAEQSGRAERIGQAEHSGRAERIGQAEHLGRAARVDQAERTEHSEHGRAGPFGGTVRSGNAGPVKNIAELEQPRSIGAARQRRYTGTGNRSARRKADRSVELEGGLEILDLSRLLRLIRAGRKSGTLVLRQDGKKGLIYWQEGAIVGAMHGGWEGREALRRLFQWKRGSFQFIRGPVPVGSLVGERWESVVLDGARSVSDPELWEKAVPRDECAPRKRRALDRIFLRQLLTYQEWQLLNHVDGNRTVEDLAQLLHWPIEQVRRHMYPLLAIGAVECVDAVEPKVRQKSARVRPRRGERSGASTSKATAIARRRARQPHGKREVKVISLDSARRNAK